ncbi:MAG: hypothetical protein U9R17_06990, partial [Thermodesulfobacteriota bacterium]|nr:hypothetical protein [Thermodesulfobacteriota bacterium]
KSYCDWIKRYVFFHHMISRDDLKNNISKEYHENIMCRDIMCQVLRYHGDIMCQIVTFDIRLSTIFASFLSFANSCSNMAAALLRRYSIKPAQLTKEH